MRVWTGFICLRVTTSSGSCEHDNVPLGSLKGVGISCPTEWLLAAKEEQ
jgi:hypothetical protein